MQSTREEQANPEEAWHVVLKLQVSPTTLFFIEGTGQTGLADCFGDGFFTDDDLIRHAIILPNALLVVLKQYHAQCSICRCNN